MNLNNIAKSIKRTAHMCGFKIKKASPEILLVSGIVAGGGAIILACKETLDIEEILDEHEEMMEKIQHSKDIAETQGKDFGLIYAEDMKKDIQQRTVVAYLKTAGKMIKHYAPSVGLFALSVTCLVASHNILEKRYLAAVAAYQTLDMAFKNYRANVIEKFGEQADYDITHKETIVNENGEEVIYYPASYCSKFFEEGSSLAWQPDKLLNQSFLNMQRNYCQGLLESRGYLLLNDVYKALELVDQNGNPLRTEIGDNVGWIYNKYSNSFDDAFRDNYVDFGFKKDKDFMDISPDKREFNYVMLEFNVDGWIKEDLRKYGLRSEY